MALDTSPQELVYDFPIATVEVKDNLSDATWTTLSHFYCDKLTLAVNAYDEALISYELGDTMQPGTAAFADYQPVGLLGKYVRLTIPQTAPRTNLVWAGFVVATANQRSAVKAVGVDKKLTGRTQVVRAVGLEYFLDRVQIDGAKIYNPDSPPTYAPVSIFRSIPFNGGKGVALDADTSTRANCNPDGTAQDGVTIFDFVSHGEAPELWTLTRVINYLLFYFSTKNAAGTRVPARFIVDGDTHFDGVLDGISPTLDPDGMTVFQCLNRLLSPQRGFVWWTRYDESAPGDPVVRIHADSISASAISLPSLGTIPANRDQEQLDLESQRDIADMVVAESGSRIYHQAIARGSRMTSTVSFGLTDELIIDWHDDIETEYDAGSTAVGATAEMHDAFRSAERFYRVYNAIRINPAWDGKSGDGLAAARDWSFPVLSDSGSVVSSLPFNVDGLKILNNTRLKRGWDYEDTSTIEVTTPDGTEAEYMPAMAIVKVATGTSGGPDRYQKVERLSQVEFDGEWLPVGDVQHSYHLLIQQTTPGILLRPSNGINHGMALNHWAGAAETLHPPEVDYETLRLTCTLEADAYCESKYPEDVDLPAGVPLQKLVIYAGKEYRLDFLAENTVVDLAEGVPILTNGGVLRDDRKQLQDVARVAHQWYQVDRFPITVTFRQVMNVVRLGMLITSVGSGTPQVNVNTVVSTIEFDFLQGTTTVKTHDEGLDFTAIV
jgi:hypothetical protein